MLAKWLGGMTPVHLARTRAEREAVYRFRYEIYVDELGRKLGGADHERRMVVDEQDEQPTSAHLYAGSADDIQGVVRVRCWPAGQVPDHEREILALDRIPAIEAEGITEIGRLMIRSSLRGKLVLPSLARAIFQHCAGRSRLAFCYCSPGLIRHYERLGYRPYSAPLIDTPDGMEVPLICVLSDRGHFREVGSPVSDLVRGYFGPGKSPPFPVDSLRHLLEGDELPVETDPGKVWGAVQDEFLGAAATQASFLDSLTERSVQRLIRKGFIVDVAKGTVVTQAGFGSREMYVVLDGTFEILAADGRRLALVGKGDLFGELAFFLESGRRTATVRAATAGQVLTIRRKFLDELSASDPDAAVKLLFNLGRILSRRLVAAERTAVLSRAPEEE